MDANEGLNELPGIVRSLRKRLGKTQREFAGTLGVAQTTVSQYESGLTAPSSEVLLKMNVLAEGMDIRAAINRQIELRFSDEKEASAHFFASIAKDVFIAPTWPRIRNVSVDFVKEVNAFLTQTNPLTFEISSDLLRILRLYRLHFAADVSQAAFRKVADFLEVQFTGLLPLDSRAAKAQANPSPETASRAQEKRRAGTTTAVQKKLAKPAN